MRQDQRARLLDLSERLAEVVLEEADPAMWPGKGKQLAEMTNDERGNRYWAKKNAAATFVLLDRTITLAQKMAGPAGDDDEDLDEQVRKAEKEAAALLSKVGKGASKPAAKGAHGKAAG